MPADPNIYANLLQQPRSAVDYANDFAKADATRNANALQALSLRQATDVQTQRAALRSAVQGGQIDLTTQPGQANALTLAPDIAPALIKTVQDGITGAAKAQSDLGAAAASNATAGKTTQEVQHNDATAAMQKVLAFQSPADATAALNDAVASGKLDMKHATLLGRSMPTDDPVAFNAWKRSLAVSIADPSKMAELLAPHINSINTGGQQVTQAVDPITLKPTTLSSFTNTVSPDAQLQANTSTANNRAGIAKDLTIAGMNPDGSVSPNIESEAQMIAAGKMPPPSGMAATRPAAAALMARVSQINPDYDATSYGAKAAAAKGFTSGQQGNALRSISTANEHLSQLDALGDALNNGNVPIINSIGNAYGVQTGAAPAQVFNAVKNVVAQEVVKAIVAGGGSAGERDEAAHAFSSSSSPAQLKQTIAAYRTVMGAQQANLIEQRRAAGLPDSTTPGYAGAGSGAAPAGAFKITHVDGQPQ